MPIAVACPNCGSKLKAPDNAAGKKVKCPKCGNGITVPAVQAEGDFDFPPPAKQPARKPPAPVAEEPEEVPEEVPDEEEELEEAPRKKGKKGKKGKGALPRVAPVSAFGPFMCCIGYVWTLLTYFNVCGALNSIDKKLNLQAWTIFIPIYSLLYLSTVIEGVNKVIDDNGLKVEHLNNNIVMNFLLAPVSLYQIFSKYNEVADALE